jgi:hypothetical protein
VRIMWCSELDGGDSESHVMADVDIRRAEKASFTLRVFVNNVLPLLALLPLI